MRSPAVLSRKALPSPSLARQETADAAVEKLVAAYPDAKVWGRSCDLTSLEAVTEAFT